MPDAVKGQLPAMCVGFHQSVHSLAQRFLSEMRRYYYVTPTSYLEFLALYKNLLGERQADVMGVKQRYEVGLEKLAGTEESVAGTSGICPKIESPVVETWRVKL